MVGRQNRFIANETFTDEETGVEYVQGGVYDIDDTPRPSIRQWIEDGKVRDPNSDQSPEETAEAAKAKRETADTDNGDDDDDDSDDAEDEPA